MATKVNFENAVRKIQALAAVLNRPLRDVLDSGARVAAISLARSAVPYGTGADAQAMGQKAVTRDIYKVYATPGNAWEDLSDARIRRSFWTAIKAGEFDVAERFLADFGNRLKDVPFQKFDGGTAHISNRGKNGRVRLSRPLMVVIDPKNLKRYVDHKKDMVGFGKGGWADVARALGKSPRGLKDEGDISASWITRPSKSGGFGSAVHGGPDEKPTIVISNRVSYAENLLSSSAKAEALRIARERMIENLQIAVKAEVRNLRSAA